MSSGIRRRVDELGRVVIPAQYRRRLGIQDGDELEFTLDGATLVVQRHGQHCIVCDAEDELATFRDRLVCRSCRTALAVLGEGPPDAQPPAGPGAERDVTPETDQDGAGRSEDASTTAW